MIKQYNNGEFICMWEEAVTAYFKVLSECFLGGTEESNE
jgi:hypothetical protein